LFVPEAHDSVREARERERDTCPPGDKPEYPASLFDSRFVIRVEGLYSTVQSGRSGEAVNLLGASIYVKLVAAGSPELLEALLNCHNARSELERPGEPVLKEDPYWLRGRTLDISVRHDGNAYRVDIKAKDLQTAQEILRRARAFQAPLA
jgi:hypothetical protein